MKSRNTLSRNPAWLGALILALSSLFLLTGATKKLKPAELLGKHLASIGTPEARAGIRNRIVKGTASFVLSSAKGKAALGEAVFVSEGKLLRLDLPFSSWKFPGDDLIYDGDRLHWSMDHEIWKFVADHDELLKKGLMGGTLTTGWLLLDMAGRKSRLVYNGLKRLDGMEYHELRYKGGICGRGLLVLMYFDPQTFHHVQTNFIFYKEETTAGKGKHRLLHEYTLTEKFGDFAISEGLSLPHSYKLRYEHTVNGKDTDANDWSVTINEILHNQKLNPRAFILK